MVADFAKKQKGKFSGHNIPFQIAGILFFVVIVVLAFVNVKIYQKKQELALQVKNYEQQINDIEKSNENLKNEIANSDNVDYLEKIAYEQLGQQKPGEKEIIFIMPQKKVETAQKQEDFFSAKSWSAWIGGAFNWIKSKF